MSLKKEIRAFLFDIESKNDEQRGKTISGRPIVYNSRTDLGWYDEIIADGALDRADLKDVRLLVNHNVDMIPLARSRNNNENSTMQLVVVPNAGLDFRADLDVENNADARALGSAVDRGDISGMSFMFTVSREEWDDVETDHPTRRILEIEKVFEISAVTFPAYAATSIEARGLRDALESARASLESERAKRAEIELRRKRIKLLTKI